MEFTAITEPGSYSKAKGNYVPNQAFSQLEPTAAEALLAVIEAAKRSGARPRRIRLTAWDDGLQVGVRVVTVSEARELIDGRRLAVFKES